MKKGILLIAISTLSLTSFAQRSFEFTLGAGASVVDIERIVEIDEVSGTTATDWDVASFGASGQFFFASSGKINFGAELMYQHLYWYSVRVPFGSTQIFREYTVDAIKVTPILRFGGDNAFSFDIGPEFNFMDDVVIGLMMSGNYSIQISDKIEIPIKFRVDVMNGIVLTAPVALHAGVRFNM